jgi:hypothetical protein
MTKVLSFKVDFGSTQCFSQTFGVKEGSGTTHKVLEVILKFLVERAAPFGS